ncbi:PilZ domain-containing protein [Paenibacillus marinisediminis]
MQETYTNESPQHQLRVLLHSRTVLEGEECIATGVISFIEGELMDVQLPEYDQFQLGERVKVTVYSPVGIHTFTTVIIARHQGSLLFIYPPNQQSRFSERREHPRIEVRKHGFITALYGQDGSIIQLSSPMPMHLHDISLNGVGFTLLSDQPLEQSSRVLAELHIGFTLTCELRIIRSALRDGKSFCGAAMGSLDDEGSRGLQAFILREQIEAYVEAKKKAHH